STWNVLQPRLSALSLSSSKVSSPCSCFWLSSLAASQVTYRSPVTARTRSNIATMCLYVSGTLTMLKEQQMGYSGHLFEPPLQFQTSPRSRILGSHPLSGFQRLKMRTPPLFAEMELHNWVYRRV